MTTAMRACADRRAAVAEESRAALAAQIDVLEGTMQTASPACGRSGSRVDRRCGR